MDKAAKEILNKILKEGEISVREAISMLPQKHRSHKDVYPLSTLIESGYIGLTFKYTPPSGAEEMREYGLAKSLYMLALPKDADGQVEYHGTNSSGTMQAENENVFIRAKGLLYLANIREKRKDMIIAFLLGLVSATAVFLITTVLENRMG